MERKSVYIVLCKMSSYKDFYGIYDDIKLVNQDVSEFVKKFKENNKEILEKNLKPLSIREEFQRNNGDYETEYRIGYGCDPSNIEQWHDELNYPYRLKINVIQKFCDPDKFFEVQGKNFVHLKESGYDEIINTIKIGQYYE